jgi:hypothetical protein
MPAIVVGALAWLIVRNRKTVLYLTWVVGSPIILFVPFHEWLVFMNANIYPALPVLWFLLLSLVLKQALWPKLYRNIVIGGIWAVVCVLFVATFKFAGLLMPLDWVLYFEASLIVVFALALWSTLASFGVGKSSGSDEDGNSGLMLLVHSIRFTLQFIFRHPLGLCWEIFKRVEDKSSEQKRSGVANFFLGFSYWHIFLLMACAGALFTLGSFAPDCGESWSSFVSPHVLTHSVRDSAAMLDAIAGMVPGDPYTVPVQKSAFQRPSPPNRKSFASPIGRSSQPVWHLQWNLPWPRWDANPPKRKSKHLLGS